MTIKWLVAKYIEDQRRREPVNVGVIVLPDNGPPLLRFLGQRVDGQIDGRRVRWAGSARNFQAWVKYWRSGLGGKQDVALLLKRRPDDSYYLEFGGERLLGTEDLDPESFADYLFGLLVEQAVPRGLSVEQMSDGLLQRIGIRDRVERSYIYEVKRHSGNLTDSVGFDYRYVNGAVHLMQRATLVFEDERSWDVVHSVAWSFERIREAVEEDVRCLTLYKGRPSDAALLRQLGLLRDFGSCIDVGSEDRADGELRELLHLDRPFGLQPS